MAEPEPAPRVVEWPRCEAVPLGTEQTLLPILLRARKERGMLSAHPAWRFREVEAACGRLGVSLEMALSLRRHHIQLRNRGAPSYVLALGTDAQRKEEANAFEDAIAARLDALGVEVADEAAQTERNFEAYGRSRPTPDFLLPTPIAIRSPERGQARRASPPAAAVRWVEAKHFYAADSIPAGDGRSAIGKLLHTADKYVALYGPGAIVFAYGCGEALAAAIEARGALVLAAAPLDMRAVHALAVRRQ
jgi:hypothetical protein